MTKSVFFRGFGISMVLIAVCLWYAFASPVRNGVVDTFDRANHGWYVHQPPVYNACLLALAILNLPVIFVFWAMLSAIEAVVTLSPLTRATVTFVSLILLSGGWWTLVAKWRGKRDRVAASIV
jgi:hypothetical protein